ncbi:TlpA family protein disulfide reductase [Streptomyces goshikiensis]|uniref:TlpA family protein disulfide reductase n=1 Tax=Streptomyces goshikiensis TaxID=1942 RepID=UPI0036B6A3BF
MPYLVAAVVLTGVLGVLNLLLTTAVIRKLRERPSDALRDFNVELEELPAGMRVPDFHAESVSGSLVNPSALAGAEAIIAFFDTNCDACKPAVGELVKYARARDMRPKQVVAVIGGEVTDALFYLEGLNGVATVITEEGMGPVTSAFSLQGVPAYCIVDGDGVIVRSGNTKTGLNPRARI